MHYVHQIEIDEANRKITVLRVFSNGEKDIYTETDVPIISLDEDRAAFDSFCLKIGQMLMANSEAARKMFKI